MIMTICKEANNLPYRTLKIPAVLSPVKHTRFDDNTAGSELVKEAEFI
jgi:hypothetical protein